MVHWNVKVHKNLRNTREKTKTIKYFFFYNRFIESESKVRKEVFLCQGQRMPMIRDKAM